jgi:signal peptidase II
MLVGLALIAGGSIGNLIDRLANGGFVVDFINVGAGEVRSGVFNMADIAVLTGALVLLRVMGKQSARIDA